MSRNKWISPLKNLSVGALFFLSFSEAEAQQPLSLDECFNLAHQNNIQILNDELAVVSARYKTAEMKSSLLPRVDLSSQYQYYINLPEQYAPASAFGGPEGEYNRMSLNMPQTLSSQVQISQPLINKEMHARVHSAELYHSALIVQTDLTKETVRYNIASAYYRIQVLDDNLLRLRENIRNLEKTVEINSVLKENELIAANVHHRLLINIESLRNEYENQQLSLDKNISHLKYLMNMDMQDTLVIMAFDTTADASIDFVADISQRADLRFQRTQIEIAEQEMRTIHARYAPSVTATIGSGFTGYNDELAPYQQINGDWINGTYVAVNAKVPLFAGYQKKHQLSQQKLSIIRSVNTLSLVQLNAEKEIMDARRNYDMNKIQLVNTKNSLALAQQLFDSAQNDYVSGISTMTDLLNAQNDLSGARTNYSNALLNLKLSELAVRKAYGIL